MRGNHRDPPSNLVIKNKVFPGDLAYRFDDILNVDVMKIEVTLPPVRGSWVWPMAPSITRDKSAIKMTADFFITLLNSKGDAETVIF